MIYYKKQKFFENRKEIIEELQKRLPLWVNKEFWELQSWTDLINIYECLEKKENEKLGVI